MLIYILYQTDPIPEHRALRQALQSRSLTACPTASSHIYIFYCNLLLDSRWPSCCRFQPAIAQRPNPQMPNDEPDDVDALPSIDVSFASKPKPIHCSSLGESISLWPIGHWTNVWCVGTRRELTLVYNSWYIYYIRTFKAHIFRHTKTPKRFLISVKIQHVDDDHHYMGGIVLHLSLRLFVNTQFSSLCHLYNHCTTTIYRYTLRLLPPFCASPEERSAQMSVLLCCVILRNID